MTKLQQDLECSPRALSRLSQGSRITPSPHLLHLLTPRALLTPHALLMPRALLTPRALRPPLCVVIAAGAPPLLQTNALGVGNKANHPPKGTQPNVFVHPLDLGSSEHPSLHPHVPVVNFRPPAPDEPVKRTVVLIAARPLRDGEEIYLDYKLRADGPVEPWYHHVVPPSAPAATTPSAPSSAQPSQLSAQPAPSPSPPPSPPTAAVTATVPAPPPAPFASANELPLPSLTARPSERVGAPLLEEVSTRGHSLHWVSAGLILYAFAAPSSISGVAFTFSHGGLLLGVICCIGSTGASATGALLLLEVILACRARSSGGGGGGGGANGMHMLSDVASAALGPWSCSFSLMLQMVNFLLYMPIALLTTAQALQEAVQPSRRTCTDYFIFGVSFVCFASTQLRDLKHAAALAGFAMVAALVAAALQLVVVSSSLPLPDMPPPAPWAGAPAGSGGSGRIEMALSLTTCVWAYVPSLIVVELASEMRAPEELRRSILLSAALNVLIFVGVGLPVAVAWGTTVADPITLSPHWPGHAPAARAVSGFLCVANFVGYCLDSVPLARWCQRRFVPSFRGGWSARSMGIFALASLPAFAFALLASILVGAPGGLFTMLAWCTALTVPACNLILPACFALVASSRERVAQAGLVTASPQAFSSAEKHVQQQARGSDSSPREASQRGESSPCGLVVLKLSSSQRNVARAVLAVGIGAFAICLIGAVGKLADASVRGPQVIGCLGWEIYHSNGTHFHGW